MEHESHRRVISVQKSWDVIKNCDYVVDMGPEGGDGGSQVIARGSPEEIAKVKKSFTGKYLKDLLWEVGFLPYFFKKFRRSVLN